eukprot:1825294-Rhodomonas_salina.1
MEALPAYGGTASKNDGTAAIDRRTAAINRRTSASVGRGVGSGGAGCGGTPRRTDRTPCLLYTSPSPRDRG